MNNNSKKEKAKNDLLEIVKSSDYKMLSEYEGVHKKVNLECPSGHEWSVSPSHFKRGVRCPYCQGVNTYQAKERFFKMVKEEGYKCYSEYAGNKKKVKMECTNGHKFEQRPNDFMTGHRCRFCGYDNEYQRSQKEKSYVDLKKIATERGFKILGEYITTETKIEMQCPNGHIRKYNIDHFKKGFGCPNCSSYSIGEQIAIQILDNRNVDYEVQKSFDGLVGLNGGLLRFDFYINNKNTAIEIQGMHHFKYDKFMTRTTIEHDNIKREFCKNNNIKLYEINYFSNELGLDRAKEEVINTLNNILDSLSL